MLKKIAIIGPESTGKSTLAAQLAKALGTVWVPEYAREYIYTLDRPYVQHDLLNIAKSHYALEKKLANMAKGFLILDTTLTIIRVWSEHKYKNCHEWILQKEKELQYDLHIVCDIDIPWEPDPQREHPHLRDYFLDIYLAHAKANPPYLLVSGDEQKRLEMALEAVRGLG